jgi:dCMP deaminase
LDVRPGWDEYFLTIATAVSMRADCRRRKVGCVIVDNDHYIVHKGTGYNGVRPGQKGCLEGACPRGAAGYEDVPAGSSYDTGPGACIGFHAEMNAIAKAGDHCMGATIYVTCEPCHGCLKLIWAARIAKVIWADVASPGNLYDNPGIIVPS